MAASAAGGPVGKVAAYFLNLWQHTTLPEVFSALMAMDLADPHPARPYESIGTDDLVPPAVALQAFLERGGRWEEIRSAGLPRECFLPGGAHRAGLAGR